VVRYMLKRNRGLAVVRYMLKRNRGLAVVRYTLKRNRGLAVARYMLKRNRGLTVVRYMLSRYMRAHSVERVGPNNAKLLIKINLLKKTLIVRKNTESEAFKVYFV
jgi:hypothetical protein